MLDPKTSDKLNQKSAQALLKAIDYFPELLALAEPEASAKIIADLIKTQLTRPEPESDPTQALTQIMERVKSEVAAAGIE